MTDPGPPRRTNDARATLALVARAVQVRFRFAAILLAAFLVVGQWETIGNHAGTIARRWFGAAPTAGLQAVSTDTEYFCPMDPGVLSDWPGKCGVCNMALVRRKRGEATPRPDGVIARMQFSPYRVQFAGLRTAPAEYLPLELEARGVGTVVRREGSVATARVSFFERDRDATRPGQPVSLLSDGFPAGHPSLPGKIVGSANDTVEASVDDPDALLLPGATVTAFARRPLSEIEPFRSQPVGPPTLHKGEPRALYACPEHPATLRSVAGNCPIEGAPLQQVPLADNQRVTFACPRHPAATSEGPGAACESCGERPLEPRIITYRPAGKVLAVPEPSVVDTGIRAIVYVEAMPGTFDAVEVKLGPRCGGHYPVASGLEAGDRVATAGAFLLDAETRIDPSLAAAYFGSVKAEAKAQAGGPNLLTNATDRALAESQKQTCPVTRKPLGSMGVPVRIEVEGRAVLICCAGCAERLRKDPRRYLTDLPGAQR